MVRHKKRKRTYELIGRISISDNRKKRVKLAVNYSAGRLRRTRMKVDSGM